MQYYQAIGKPTPKVEVTNFLKGEEYIDAKDFAGDCEPVVMIAKGQSTSLCSTRSLILLIYFFKNRVYHL